MWNQTDGVGRGHGNGGGGPNWHGKWFGYLTGNHIYFNSHLWGAFVSVPIEGNSTGRGRKNSRQKESSDGWTVKLRNINDILSVRKIFLPKNYTLVIRQTFM